MPTDWAYVAEQLRFYPIPAAAYGIIISGTYRWPTLVNPLDSNPWTNDAEELIRLHAKGILFEHIERDAGMAQVCMRGAMNALADLQAETTQRGPETSIRVRSFF